MYIARMNARDLDATTRALNKAIAAKEPPTKILNILETLKNGGLPTEEMLRVGPPLPPQFGCLLDAAVALAPGKAANIFAIHSPHGPAFLLAS